MIAEDLLGGLRLIPLDKNPGVRPIGCGEPLLKLVRGAWHRYLAPAIPKAFLPFQFACSLPAGIEALGRDILLEHEEATKVGHHQIFIKRDARNFYNELDRAFIIRVLKSLDPFFAQYIARVLGTPTVYTLFEAGEIADPASERGLLEFSTVSGVVQGDVLGFLIGCAVAADAARAWSLTLASAFPRLRVHGVSDRSPPTPPAAIEAGNQWRVHQAEELQRVNEFWDQGQSPFASIRGYVDDQTLLVPKCIHNLCVLLLKAVFLPSGTTFRADKNKDWDPVENPAGGLVVAGISLWNIVRRPATDKHPDGFSAEFLEYSVGNVGFLNQSCHAADLALSSGVEALKEIWIHRPKGRPCLPAMLRVISGSLAKRFTHFARWFVPEVSKPILEHLQRELCAFVFWMAGWDENGHFTSEAHRNAVLREIQLPVRKFGGLGLGFLPSIEAAFVSSWLAPAKTLAEVRGVDVEALLASWDQAHDEGHSVALTFLFVSMSRLHTPATSCVALWKGYCAVNKIEEAAARELVPGEKLRVSWQEYLSQGVWESVAETLQNGVHDLHPDLQAHEYLRLQARQHPYASWALFAMPSPSWGVGQLEDGEALDWLAWSFGVPLNPVDGGSDVGVQRYACKKCSLTNQDGVLCHRKIGLATGHPGACPMRRFTRLHHMIVRTLFLEFRSMGFATDREVWEPSLNRKKNGKWVAAKLDLRIENFAVKLAPRPTVMDVSLVHVTAPSYLPQFRDGAWRGVGKGHESVKDAMASRVQLKHDEYQVRDPVGRRSTSLRLLPFVLNHYGSWDESAMSILKEACSYSGKRGNLIVDKISVDVARYVSRQLRQSLAAVYWDRPGLPATNLELTSHEILPPLPSATPAAPRPTGSGGGDADSDVGMSPAGKSRGVDVAKAPARSRAAAEATLAASGGAHGMSAVAPGSASSSLVAHRTEQWQARGGSKSVLPPGTHRGLGALPAPIPPQPHSRKAARQAPSQSDSRKAANKQSRTADGVGFLASGIPLAPASGSPASGVSGVLSAGQCTPVLDVERGARVLSASAAASAAAGQHLFSSGVEVLGTAATLAGERELGRARGEQAVDRKGEPKATPRAPRRR